MMHPLFTDEQFEVIRFCARECELQQSGEASVAHMVAAWQYAFLASTRADRPMPVIGDVFHLGVLVEPDANRDGFRKWPVTVGGEPVLDWRTVPGAIERLLGGLDTITPEEFFREYEEIHPFVDGNGRTGVILYSWLKGTLRNPDWPPNFWNDPRRVDGSGA